MAQHGVSYSGTFEFVSPADKFFRYIANNISRPADPKPEETIQYWSRSVNWEKKRLIIEMSGFASGNYKTATTTITVIPNEDGTEGGRVMWTLGFEKIRDDISDPHFIIDRTVDYLKESDGKLKLY